MRARQTGFTLVEIMITLMIIALLASISYPSYVKARANAKRAVCQSNLKSISSEAEVYLFEFPATENLSPTDLKDRFKSQEVPVCPSGGNYSININIDPFAFCDHGDGHAL
jgi:prepilin-type N-terminal cleavage/methylation domain-containing protein